MLEAVTTARLRMELRDVDVPQPRAGEALVRIEAVGLCGSDYHLFDGTHPYAHYPQVQGHEIVGIVEEASGHGHVRAGDRVVIEPLLLCGACIACRRGRYNCCAKLRVMGAHAPGGLREFMPVPIERLHRTMAVPQVAVLTEPVSIGLQCIMRAELQAGDEVVVIGGGPIGQAVALSAVDRGARVVVVDRVPRRLEMAARMGASLTINSSLEDVRSAVADFTRGDGPLVVIEATGVPRLLRLAIDLVAASGIVVVVGISSDEVSIPVSDFSRKEISVVGSRNSSNIFPLAADLVVRHSERLRHLVTHTFPLREAPTAIDFARKNPEVVVKVVVVVAG